MNGRVVVAALLGGLTIWIWSALSHMVIGLGEMGVSKLPNEPATLAALDDTVKEGGLYIFPMEEDPAKWEAALANNPSGMMSIRPAGSPVAFGRRLGVEYTTNAIAAFLAIMLLGSATNALQTVGQRAVAGATLGAFATMSVDASYWNWYDFPTPYLVGAFLDQTIGWALAMLVAGWWLARRR